MNIRHGTTPTTIPPIPEEPSRSKSLGTAVLLTIFFGPMGLFYSSVIGGIVMSVACLAAGLLTMGLGLIITWPICVLWAVLAVGPGREAGDADQWTPARMASTRLASSVRVNDEPPRARWKGKWEDVMPPRPETTFSLDSPPDSDAPDTSPGTTPDDDIEIVIHPKKNGEGEVAFCHQCGARVGPGARFCSRCGAELE